MADQGKAAANAEIWAAGIGRRSRAEYGSDLAVEVLRELGIRYIALNPGASYRGLHDSLVNFEPGSGPELILCTHEEIAVALANGYARATGEVMATGLHDIVGLQHASMAIFNAWCDRTPILNLGGGGPQNTINRRSTDWVHTALVQGNMVREFVKYDDQPSTVEALPEALLKAYRIATTEPKGPVYVCLDTDVQEQRIASPLVVPDARLFRAPAPPAPNPEALRRAAQLLAEAEWPVIVAGEVGRNPVALPPLLDLAELLGAPVIDADGRYAFPSTHPLNLTTAREQALRDADTVLALDVPSLGVPLGPSVRERGNFAPVTPPSAKIIHVTLLDLERQSWVSDGMWLLPVAVPIAADTAIALPQLLEEVRRRGVSREKAASRRAKVEAIYAEARRKSREWLEKSWDETPISQARLYGEINRRVERRSWALVSAHGRRWREALEVTEPAHGLGGGRGGGVGYGLPSSIGAALGFKGSGRLCVGVIGDGDFMMTSNALWTAAKYEIPLLVVVLNNRSYYNDEEHQERMARWRGRPVENKGIGIRIEDPAPDIAAIARALSVAGFGPITEPAALGPALDEAIAVVDGGRPAVVDVVTQPR
ncbi:MAG TPA: thiamine pyrophosphate-dependent enzyme [candidate division Zixibacteria bacterium]|nr:thiamine pyrophosphate-dependent enzyme [candidate division Zixibacteria bacterium]